MKKAALLIFIIFFTVCSFAQVTNEGKPASWDMVEQKTSLKAISLAPVDIQKVKNEDEVNDKIRTKPYSIGLQIKVDYGLENSGEWTELENGDRIWRIGFSSKDALNLGLIFDKFYLPEGGKIYLYNDDKSDLLGAYTDSQNNEKEVLTTWFVNGDKIWMEYYEPAEVKNEGKLHIASVMHGYRLGHKYQKGYYKAANTEDFFNSSGDCNQDVDCPIGADFETSRDLLKKGVGFLLIPISSTRVGLCTGTLINNTAQDRKPYFLTAFHCTTGRSPSTYAMRFNWISPNPVCASTNNSTTTPDNFTMSGATMRAQNSNSDFTLVELNSPIPNDWDVTFAGWDRRNIAPNFVVSIHHPQGDIMKISRDDSGVEQIEATIEGQTSQTWLITATGNGWELGVTEGGSSGGALFNQDGRIIGQLFGGNAACDGTNDNDQVDVYGRFDLSWDTGATAATRLSDWLNPSGAAPNTLDALENVLSVNDEFLEQNITIYPNPTSGLVKVKASGLVGDLSYEVFNLLGQSLKADMLQNETIQLNNLSNNIYFIKIKEVETSKILVKKIVLSR